MAAASMMMAIMAAGAATASAWYYPKPTYDVSKNIKLVDKQYTDIHSDLDSYVDVKGNAALAEAGADAVGHDTFTGTFTHGATTPWSSESYSSSAAGTKDRRRLNWYYPKPTYDVSKNIKLVDKQYTDIYSDLDSYVDVKGNAALAEAGADAVGYDTFTGTFSHGATTPWSSESYSSSAAATKDRRRLNWYYAKPTYDVSKNIKLVDKQYTDIYSDLDSYVDVKGNAALAEAGADAVGHDTFTGTFSHGATTPWSSESYSSSAAATKDRRRLNWYYSKPTYDVSKNIKLVDQQYTDIYNDLDSYVDVKGNAALAEAGADAVGYDTFTGTFSHGATTPKSSQSYSSSAAATKD